jgi:hypothetical protein
LPFVRAVLVGPDGTVGACILSMIADYATGER